MKTGEDLTAARITTIKAETTLMTKMIQCIVASYLGKARIATCEGCQQGYLSQRDHPCLTEDVEYHLAGHFEEGCKLATSALLKSLYECMPVGIDVESFKSTHMDSIHEGVEIYISNEGADTMPKAFKNFYNAMKMMM